MSTTPDATTKVLDERGARYGKFAERARVTQQLKAVVAAAIGDNERFVFEPDHVEALEMIVHKIGRIVCGDPDYDDSWVDIAGYARLVADRLQGTVR